jgi:hypothetical protein
MNAKNKSSNVITVLVPVLIILVPLLYSVVGYVGAQGKQSSQPFIEKPDAKYESCVRETEYMRYHHWDLLRGIRIKVVRHGEPQEIGFDKCRECHPNRAQFCNRCHNAVSLYPDCWGCHYYPESPETELDEAHLNEMENTVTEFDSLH